MIRLTDVAKTYNDGKTNAFTALSSVHLTLPENRIIAFEGPSGSGKTTLLTLIGGMARPTTGRIHIGNQEIASLPERFLSALRRKRFGFVFQRHNLVRGLTVLDNILLPAFPDGPAYGPLKRRGVALLETLRIADKANQRVELLSGGEQQRVAIARALINDPDHIIADEPTAHLDTALGAAFLDIMANLRAEGKTVFLASHDPLVCGAPVIDQVVALRDGRVVETGSPSTW